MNKAESVHDAAALAGVELGLLAVELAALVDSVAADCYTAVADTAGLVLASALHIRKSKEN